MALFPASSIHSAGESRRTSPCHRDALGFLTPILLAALCALPAAAAHPEGNAAFDRKNSRGSQVLVRAAAATVADLAAKHGLTIVAAGEADGHLAVVEGPAGMSAHAVERLLRHAPHVASVSPATVASVPDVDGVVLTSSADVGGDLLRAYPFAGPCAAYAGMSSAGPWAGYGDQEAAAIVRLHEAQASAGCGAGVVVAVLDTGVDGTHPLLAGAMTTGMDLVGDHAPGEASDWSNVDQSVRAIVEQSVRAIVEESEIAVIGGDGEIDDGGAMSPIVASDAARPSDLPLPPAFGHGTMVAGLVRWAAPGARIMPLRVFDGDGSGHVFDIVRAIYWAVDHGADVINMSFSTPQFDLELHRAVEYAKSRGVVSVAAAGNGGSRGQVYPAALASAVGVAASDDHDALALFSNWGSQVADLAAPGAGLVTAYPGGLYAAGWGTSFAAPLVSGTLALVQPRYAGGRVSDHLKQVKALLKGSAKLEQLMGATASGRLDAMGTVHEAN